MRRRPTSCHAYFAAWVVIARSFCAPAVRLGMDRKYPICPMRRGVLPRFLFQRAQGVCQPAKAHRQPMGFYRPATTRKARIGKVERGTRSHAGFGFG